MNDERAFAYRFKNVLRVAYTLPFVMASITGAVFALTIRQEWLMALLIPLDVFFLAMFVNLTNDYFDHKSGTDKVRFTMTDRAFEQRASGEFSQKMYWQGNSFDRGLITEKGGKRLILFLATVACTIALPIVLFGGILVLVMGAVAFFLSFFYTAPPLNLGSRGLGELDVGLSFTFMAFFSYYVIVQQFSWIMLLISITVGMNVMNMRIVDEMSGREAHKAAGERDLVVRLGIDGATSVMTGAMVCMYALCAVLVYINWTYVLLFLTIPLSFKAIRYLRQKKDEFWMIRPVLEVFKLALAHTFLVVVILTLQSAVTFV